MGPITLGLALACIVAAAFTLIGRDARRDHDDGRVALALAQVWALGAATQMIAQLLPPSVPPFYVWFGPPVDLLVALYVWRFHRAAPAMWKRLVVVISALQLTAHIAYGLGDLSRDALNAYKFALNVSFLGQLACVMWPGGLHGVRRFFARLSPGAGGLHQRGREGQ